MRALIIDDSKAMRSILARMLRALEFEVVEAANGREGLALCAGADLVILDIFMPEKDGLEVLLELHRRRAGVKVIAISGGILPGTGDSLRASLHLGAAKTLQKPFTIEELMAAVNGVLPAGGAEDRPVSHP